MMPGTRAVIPIPVPQTVLACETCAEGATFGVAVFQSDEARGPLYECRNCGCFYVERRCPLCGRFAKLISDISCPMQDEDDYQHNVRFEQLCLCPICDDAGVETQYFEPSDIVGHLRDHEEG